MSSALSTQSPTDVLQEAVVRVLNSVRPGEPEAGARLAEASLRDALRGAHPDEDNFALLQALACAEAACEHLKYCEIQEARTLLTAARGQLKLAERV